MSDLLSPDLDDDPNSDEGIVREAKRRFRACVDWEAEARRLARLDVRFAMGDAENNWQWPDEVWASRNSPTEQRPSLTVNKTRQHCLQIINDARQNKMGIVIRPTGGGASYEAAQIREGIVRYIERRSRATEAYEAGAWWQVFSGCGYWRVVTDYADDQSFDLDIFIRRVKDRFSVYLDKDIKEYDGSDARYGFIFRDMDKRDFRRAYPKFADAASDSALDFHEDWLDKDRIRVCEYFRKVAEKDRLLALIDGTTVRESELDEAQEPLVDESREPRAITRDRVEWFLIAGSKLVDKKPWPGRYIPIVRCVGEELILDGKLDQVSHVRALKDPQRIYNYWTSAAVEHVALQSKTPYVAPAAAIEGLEEYWNTANTQNHAVLPYNQFNDDGREMRAPERQAPPTMAPAFVEGMKISAQEMMMVSGQWQSEFGQPSNERSGVAIQQRQRQADNATYHYVDHLSQAIRFTGEIVNDLIPHVYDTQRVVRILAEDEKDEREVHIDPDAQQAISHYAQATGQPLAPDQVKQLLEQQRAGEIRTVLNPGVGQYLVECDIGPAFATKRQEAFNAFSQIVAQNHELMPIIGDLMFKAADFPMADEIAERLKAMVPPQAQGGPTPQQMQAQQQMQKMQAMIAELQKKLADQSQDMERKQYEAETRRMQAIGGIDAEAFKPVIRELISQALGQPIVPVMAMHAAADQAMQPPAPQPVPGGPQAPAPQQPPGMPQQQGMAQ